MDSALKYLGTPDCGNCQNGAGDNKCGLNPNIGSEYVKNFDICIRFFRKQDGLNTHYKTPGVFYRDGERCQYQFIGEDIEWRCNQMHDNCTYVCIENKCPHNPDRSDP